MKLDDIYKLWAKNTSEHLIEMTKIAVSNPPIRPKDKIKDAK